MKTRLNLLILPLLSLGVAEMVGCHNHPVRDPLRGYDADAANMGMESVQDVTPIYRQMGLVARYTPVPFVGRVSYFATNNPDTTLALFSVSLPNHGLTFIYENGQYRAQYQVQLQVTQGQTAIRRIDALEVVRVGNFKETTRTDESIIFQQALRVPPGAYSLAFLVRDGGSGKTSVADIPVDIPKLKSGTLSTLLTVYEATARTKLDSVPRIIAAPRSSAIFGRDSTVDVYVEGYGDGSKMPLSIQVSGSKGKMWWSDTVSIGRNGQLFSGTVHVPVARADIGVATLSFARLDQPAADTMVTHIFVGFGEDLPMMSFDDMLTYLKFYASPSRIKSLREAPPDKRASMWAAFLRATDPIPTSPQHEDLESYFGRIQEANVRFRDDGATAGWLSNRGMAYVSLGEPDNITEQVYSRRSVAGTVKYEVWDYRDPQVQLVFVNDGDVTKWHFAPGSENTFWTVNSRRLVK